MSATNFGTVMSATNFGTALSPPVRHFSREVIAEFERTPVGKAMRLRQGLTRLFPGIGMSTQPIDHGNALRVSFYKVRHIDCFGMTLPFGIHRAIDAPLNADPMAVGGKILRAAYPRGWAVP